LAESLYITWTLSRRTDVGPEDGGNMCLRNVSVTAHIHTVLCTFVLQTKKM
jgi:hypothetical protein